ncbi:MAG: hypothetical protein AB2722_10075 [Candidatus Thiodiazotropha sp.]|nr:transcriptional antiterminator, Rof [Candidatus Thiodiazotropha taylori]
MKDDYLPIPCAQHEAYQYAVIKGVMLDLSWRDGRGVKYGARARPIDVVTRDGAEFLVIKQQDGSIHSIRLDRIIGAYRVIGGERLMG